MGLTEDKIDDGGPKCRRTDFLIEYYKVLWTNINRHIQGMWQTVTTLGGSVALLALTGQGIISISFSATLIVGLSTWYAATAYDSALWFSRNQVIATNIERLFLNQDDKRQVQPYFTEHRRNPIISHFKIALWLSRGIVAAVLLYHWIEVVHPYLGMEAPLSIEKVIPHIALLIYVIVEKVNHHSIKDSYEELVQEKSK